MRFFAILKTSRRPKLFGKDRGNSLRVENNRSLVGSGAALLICGQHLTPTKQAESGTPYLTGPADFGVRVALSSRFAAIEKAISEDGDVLLTVKGELERTMLSNSVSRFLLSTNNAASLPISTACKRKWIASKPCKRKPQPSWRRCCRPFSTGLLKGNCE